MGGRTWRLAQVDGQACAPGRRQLADRPRRELASTAPVIDPPVKQATIRTQALARVASESRESAMLRAIEPRIWSASGPSAR